MALATPFTLEFFGNLIPIQSAPFVLMDQDEISGLGTGEGLTHDLGPKLWEAPVETAPMPNGRCLALQAMIEALDGSQGTFYLYNPMAPYPQADPDGSLIAGHTPELHTIALNRKEVRIDGLPAGYVLTGGDMFALDYGSPSRRALLRCVTGATADQVGVTPLFEVRPHLRPGITVGLPVLLARPAAKVKILPGTLSLQPVDIVNARLSFRVRQTLAAG